MFSRKFYFIILSLVILSSILPYHATYAQENSTTITATVTVQNLNIRYAPTNTYWLDEDSTLIGQLHQGDVVTVLSYEGIEGYYYGTTDPWIYVTHPESGLTGWVYSQYLVFSDANWQEILPHVDTWHELGQEIAQNNQPFPAIVWYQGAGIYLRAEPYYGSALTYLLPHTQSVTVTGAAKINGVIRFVYVEATDSEAAGWVASFKVIPAINDAYEGWEKALPVFVERDLRTEFANYPTAIIVTGKTYDWQTLYVRATPSTEGAILAAIPPGMHLAVHGRTNHDTEGWVYVTVIEGQGRYFRDYNYLGLSGWIFDPNWDAPYLKYDNGVQRSSLPIINP